MAPFARRQFLFLCLLLALSVPARAQQVADATFEPTNAAKISQLRHLGTGTVDVRASNDVSIGGQSRVESQGGALSVAMTVAREVENATIVFVVCDRGDRYLSTGVFDQ